MTMSDNAANAMSLFDEWEKRDFDALGDLMAEGIAIIDSPAGRTLSGKSEAKDWFGTWASGCPDSVAGVRVVAASDDTVVVEGVYEGTNTAAFGPMPAKGRTVAMPFASVLRFDTSGHVSSFTGYYDQVTLMTQLGHMEPPAGA
jgi:steroid delta-isomerase-like uncharacterized protein